MSQSTITAEGGTITLSTAPDGEITASSADFAVYVVQQVEGGGSGVTHFPGLSTVPFKLGAGLYASNALNGSATTATGTADDQEIVPFIATFDLEIDEVAFQITSASAGSSANILVFDADENGRPTALLFQSGAIDTTASTGLRSVAATFTFLAGKLYWIGVWCSAGLSLRRVAANSSQAIGWTDANPSLAYHCLIRSVAHGGTSPAWTYDNTQLSTRLAPGILLRAA